MSWKARQRSKPEIIDPGPDTTVTIEDSVQTYGPFGTVVGSRILFCETMADVVGRRTYRFNPCVHERFRDSTIRVNELRVTHSAPYGETVYSFGGYGPFTEGLLPMLREFEYPINNWLDDVTALADHHFQNAVKEDSDLIETLVELREFWKGLMPRWRNWKLTLINLLDKLRKQFLKFTNAIQNGMSWWLAYNFFLKPTLEEMVRVLLDIEKAVKRWKWLVARAGKTTTVHYRAQPFKGEYAKGVTLSWGDGYWIIPITNPPQAPGAPAHVFHPNGGSDTGGGEEEDGGSGGQTVKVELVAHGKYSVTFTAWADCMIVIPDWMNDWTGPLLVWLKSIQALNPAKLIWALTKWTWLFDMFVSRRDKLTADLGGWNPFAGAITIKQFGSTLVFEHEGWVELINHSNGERMNLGKFSYSSFTRREGYPEVVHHAFRLPFGVYEGSILGSILGTRIEVPSGD